MKKIIISIILSLTLIMSTAFTREVEALNTNVFAKDCYGYTLADGKGFFADEEYLNEDLSVPAIVVEFYYTEVNGQSVDYKNNPELYVKQISIIDLPNNFYNDFGFKPSHFEYVEITTSKYVIPDNILINSQGKYLPNSSGKFMLSESTTLVRYTYWLVHWNDELEIFRPEYTEEPFTTVVRKSDIPLDLLECEYVGVYNGSYHEIEVKDYTKKITVSAFPNLEINPTGWERRIIGSDDAIYVVIYFDLIDLDYDNVLSFSYSLCVKQSLFAIDGLFTKTATINETIVCDEYYERENPNIFVNKYCKFDKLQTDFIYGFYVQQFGNKTGDKKYTNKALGGKVSDLVKKNVWGTAWMIDNTKENWFMITDFEFSYDGIIYQGVEIDTINEGIPFYPSFRPQQKSSVYGKDGELSLLDKILNWLEEKMPLLLQIIKLIPYVLIAVVSIKILNIIMLNRTIKNATKTNEKK